MSAFVHRYRRRSLNAAPRSPPSPPESPQEQQHGHYGSSVSPVQNFQQFAPEPKKEQGGLEVEILELMRDATADREVEKGRIRTPHGAETEGGRRLRERAQSKRELRKIHSRLSEMC